MECTRPSGLATPRYWLGGPCILFVGNCKRLQNRWTNSKTNSKKKMDQQQNRRQNHRQDGTDKQQISVPTNSTFVPDQQQHGTDQQQNGIDQLDLRTIRYRPTGFWVPTNSKRVPDQQDCPSKPTGNFAVGPFILYPFFCCWSIFFLLLVLLLVHLLHYITTNGQK